MTPKELAERLRDLPPHELSQMLREQAEALPRLQEGDRPSMVVTAVMSQAADLLATALVEWRVGPLGGGGYDECYSREDAVERAASAHEYARTAKQDWAFRVRAESRAVIETPWQAVSDAAQKTDGDSGSMGKKELE